MRIRLAEILQTGLARKPLLLSALATLLLAGDALAGRERPIPTTGSGGGLPATPEPGAALAFAVGVGVIVWAVRRNRKP